MLSSYMDTLDVESYADGVRFRCAPCRVDQQTVLRDDETLFGMTGRAWTMILDHLEKKHPAVLKGTREEAQARALTAMRRRG